MKEIVISGAGLGGSLLAVALKQQGHNVYLFEKRSDMRISTGSAGKSINLILTAKGMKPLKELGLLDGALELTKPVLGRMIHSMENETTYQPYGRDDSEMNYSIPRSDVNKYLLTEAEKAGVKVFFDSKLETIDFDRSRASFKNQDEISFDYFFGADGAGSKTRKLLEAKGALNSKTKGLGTGYKELLMPPAKNGEYAISDTALHIWPRGDHMLMALPNKDGSFTMTIYMSDARFNTLNTKEKVEAYFHKFYPDTISLMPDYVSDFLESPVGFLGSLNVDSWVHQNKYTLLGDAAHAMVPFFGQGMNCSFSDVEFLRSRLTKNEKWEKTLSEYSIHQKLNGDAIRDLSLENFVEMCDTVGKDEFIFRKKVERIIENTFPEKYRSRYARVVYTLTPYHEAKRLGEIQKEILSELCMGLEKPEDVNLEKAQELIELKLK